MSKKFFVLAAGAFAAISIGTAAMAADLPSRKSAPVAPAYVEPFKRVYVGVNGGMYGSEVTTGTAGAVLGYNFNQNIAGELSYDYTFGTNAYRANSLVLGNVLVGQQFGVVKPYVLAGAGYQFTDGIGRNGFHWNTLKDNGRAVYALGGGVKFELSPSFEVDTRYRYVNAFDSKYQTKPENRLTVGVNYKF